MRPVFNTWPLFVDGADDAHEAYMNQARCPPHPSSSFPLYLAAPSASLLFRRAGGFSGAQSRELRAACVRLSRATPPLFSLQVLVPHLKELYKGPVSLISFGLGGERPAPPLLRLPRASTLPVVLSSSLPPLRRLSSAGSFPGSVPSDACTGPLAARRVERPDPAPAQSGPVLPGCGVQRAADALAAPRRGPPARQRLRQQRGDAPVRASVPGGGGGGRCALPPGCCAHRSLCGAQRDQPEGDARVLLPPGPERAALAPSHLWRSSWPRLSALPFTTAGEHLCDLPSILLSLSNQCPA